MPNHLVKIWNPRVNDIDLGIFLIFQVCISDRHDTFVITAEGVVWRKVVIFISGIPVPDRPLLVWVVLAINRILIFNPLVKSAIEDVNILEPKGLENPGKPRRTMDNVGVVAYKDVVFAHIELSADLLECF